MQQMTLTPRLRATLSYYHDGRPHLSLPLPPRPVGRLVPCGDPPRLRRNDRPVDENDVSSVRLIYDRACSVFDLTRPNIAGNPRVSLG